MHCYSDYTHLLNNTRGWFGAWIRPADATRIGFIITTEVLTVTISLKSKGANPPTGILRVLIQLSNFSFLHVFLNFAHGTVFGLPRLGFSQWLSIIEKPRKEHQTALINMIGSIFPLRCYRRRPASAPLITNYIYIFGADIDRLIIYWPSENTSRVRIGEKFRKLIMRD